MMKVYNETWIQNLEIQRVAKTWLKKNLLTSEEFEAIKTQFPEGFYRPNIFVKIGLFIFTCIACSAITSLFVLLFAAVNNIAVESLIFAIILFFFLEKSIKNQKFYHSGADNALLYAALGATNVAFFAMFDNLDTWQYLGFTFITLVVANLRYADVLVSIVAFGVFIALVATILIKFPLGKALLPFVIMAISAIIYYFISTNKDIYYADNQLVIEILALIFFYLSGNYLIVREANAVLNNLPQNPSPQIAFAPLFYFFTAIIPFVFIFFGLRRKDRKLLIIGLLAVAFSVFSYRFYFAILPIEWALVLGGLLMGLVAIWAINYLRKPKFGISDEDESASKFGNISSLITAQVLGKTSEPKGINFGGGDFGGGGAGSEY